uniref:luc7-like protein 3 isoform X2 n=1 Tax=Myxine glutinosa TaxID=7769 RepID=UPI00358F36C4
MLSNAQLLDELMGRDRNLSPSEKRPDVQWDDEEVCKHFLVEFCPAELFVNTRADLGPCTKVHDEKLKKQYDRSSRRMRMGYEKDFLRYLQSIMSDVERKIRRGQSRLSLSNPVTMMTNGSKGKNDEKIQIFTERIEDMLDEIENLGMEGMVDEAQSLMHKVDKMRDEREQLYTSTTTLMAYTAQEKQMDVCKICGAFLIYGDAQSRIDDHLVGKQHMGYARIKTAMEEMKEKLRKRRRDERVSGDVQEREVVKTHEKVKDDRQQCDEVLARSKDRARSKDEVQMCEQQGDCGNRKRSWRKSRSQERHSSIRDREIHRGKDGSRDLLQDSMGDLRRRGDLDSRHRDDRSHSQEHCGEISDREEEEVNDSNRSAGCHHHRSSDQEDVSPLAPKEGHTPAKAARVDKDKSPN